MSRVWKGDSTGEAIPVPSIDMSDPKSWAKVLANKMLRGEIESAMYESVRSNTHIDPDIDVHRSFSRMAKITYTRQRYVQDMMRQQGEMHWRGRISKSLASFFGVESVWNLNL